MAGTAAGRTAGQGGMARPDQPRPPRRLAMVVGRRVLVDDQHEHAAYVAEALRNSRDGVLAEVATQLRTLRRPSNWHGRLAHDNDPLVVARLRGGTAPSRDWRDEPTACADTARPLVPDPARPGCWHSTRPWSSTRHTCQGSS